MASLHLNDALADSLATAVAAGVPIETAAQAAGISARTIYGWLKAAEDGNWREGEPLDPQSLDAISRFSVLIRQAQAVFEAKQVQGVAEAAEAVNEKTGLRDWRARAWILNNHPRYRRTYRPERTVEMHQSGTVTHEHKLTEAADDDQLRAWAALPLPPEGQG